MSFCEIAGGKSDEPLNPAQPAVQSAKVRPVCPAYVRYKVQSAKLCPGILRCKRLRLRQTTPGSLLEPHQHSASPVQRHWIPQRSEAAPRNGCQLAINSNVKQY